MNKPTPGPWIADLRTGCCAIYPANRVDDTPGCHLNDDRNIHFSRKGGEYKENEGWTMDAEAQANAALIVAAVNSCFAVNPANPLAVAEALPELVEVLNNLVTVHQTGLIYPPLKVRAESWDKARAALAKLDAKS